MTAPNGTLIEWSQEHDDYIRENYRVLKTSVIATALGRTKNAIIGRANRMGLSRPYGDVFGKTSEGSPYRYHQLKSEHPRKPRNKRFPHSGQGRMNSVFSATEPDIAPLGGVGVKMWNLDSHHCRWVIGEPKDLTFCGHAKVHGSSYCESHESCSRQATK